MHGIIHLELKKFVEQSFGREAWTTLTTRCGLKGQMLLPVQTYPDEQIVALVGAAVDLSGLPATTLLESFGAFLVPAYLSMYGSLVKPDWRTLDVVEHTEETIHKVVRRQHPGASPPALQVHRTGPDQAVLIYRSTRKLCAVARGIIQGLANHFAERITIDDVQCMLQGAPLCEIRVRKAE